MVKFYVDVLGISEILTTIPQLCGRPIHICDKDNAISNRNYEMISEFQLKSVEKRHDLGMGLS